VKTETRLAASLLIALLFTVSVLAQTPAAGADPGVAAAPQVQSADGIRYLNGGAGEEARAAMDARRGEFPLRLVFSVASGAYAVADHVEVSGAKGRVFAVDNAGPMLLVQLPPGDYTVAASYGGKTERRKVRVGRDATTVNWRWPDEAKH
jgi:hypothetical protein